MLMVVSVVSVFIVVCLKVNRVLKGIWSYLFFSF